MTKKIWLIVGVVVIALIVLAAAGAGGAYFYLEYRNASWLREATTAYDKREWARAKGYFERYLPQDPKNAELLEKYADASMKLTYDRLGSLRAAVTAFQQILTYYPERDDVREDLIELYIKLSAWSTLDYYTRDWLRRAPDDETILYYNALALDNMGSIDEAMKGYEALIAKGTDHSDVYGSYARLLREKGLEAKANEVFANARAARPQDGQVVADYARFVARTSTWAEVQSLLDEALRLSPKDTDVLVAAAQANMLRRQHPRAVELLQQVIELKPDEGPAYLMLASAYIYQGMAEDAIKVLQKADALVKIDSPLMLITLADLQLGMSAFDDAKQTIGEYSAAYPDQLPISEYFTAKEMLVRGEPSEAVKRLASVVQLRPGFALAQYTLAEAYLATGETELARNALETYLSKNTTDERAQRLMAQRFGRPISIEAIAARAEELASQPEPGQERLLAIAAALLDSAVRRDAVAEYSDLIHATLEKALLSAPKESAVYRLLADLHLLKGEPSEALKDIDRGIEQGCDPAEFLMLRAGAALESNDSAGVDKYIEEAATSPGFGHMEYAQWSNFFALHGSYDHALWMLDRGISATSESEAKATLEVERALLALRHGNLMQASEWLETVTPRVALGTTLRRRLNAARLQLAQTYLITDPSDTAEQNAQKVIHAVRQEDPGNVLLRVADGLLLMRKTPPELDRAQSLFESAAVADAGGLGAQWGLAKVALASNDYPRALTHIERALTSAPNIPALRLLEAEALLRTDRRFEAERSLRRFLEEMPDDVNATQLLARCLVQRGETDEAQALLSKLETATGSDPKHAEDLRDLRAALLVAEGADAEAEKTLRTQVSEHPSDFNVLRSLAHAVMRQGREDEAKQLLMEYAEKHTTDPATWVGVAQWWAGTKSENQWREASTCLTRALLADPNYVPALRAMLDIRLRQRDNLEALQLCNRYLSRNPDDADMLIIKARLLGQLNGRQQEALAAADRAIELDDRPEYKATRGVILVAMRQYERALRDLKPYALESKEIPAIFDAALAEAYFAMNEIALAKQYLEDALTKAESGDLVDAERLRQLQQALAQKEAAA
ncbi:MAG: tetratricopeptide repeat protein [Candidatus Hydrogenedentes bacterium]|nr:tetratricopeptide repeat protein [Candidatus Hydrogenedentota bacterium]